MGLVGDMWSVWEARFRIAMKDPNKCPRGQKQVIKVVQKAWEDSPSWRIHK